MIPDEALTNVLVSVLTYGVCQLRLVKSDPVLADKDCILSDLLGREADFPGYPSGGANPTWGSPSIVSPDDGKMTCAPVHFQPSGMTSPQTIYGYFMTFNSVVAGQVLLVWVRFTTPLILASDASTIDLVVNLYDRNFLPP